ncbi:hypothetical protein H1P_10048 [Hyella patelloides LEGE 07179]|uniref:Uncharacterized protein n=1 Tax=Hyella patelloides LEGE 07179 TaxID=945734 RepID=A0A563VIP1_9CYAN|nr:hypothetical protein H1P_10048 [Hyella patelloides LEGE 07179]
MIKISLNSNYCRSRTLLLPASCLAQNLGNLRKQDLVLTVNKIFDYDIDTILSELLDFAVLSNWKNLETNLY